MQQLRLHSTFYRTLVHYILPFIATLLHVYALCPPLFLLCYLAIHGTLNQLPHSKSTHIFLPLQISSHPKTIFFLNAYHSLRMFAFEYPKSSQYHQVNRLLLDYSKSKHIALGMLLHPWTTYIHLFVNSTLSSFHHQLHSQVNFKLHEKQHPKHLFYVQPEPS